MPKRKLTKWVIPRHWEPREPGPEEPGGYFGTDGKPSYKAQAAEFGSWQAAKAFADRHGLAIDGAMVRIVTKGQGASLLRKPSGKGENTPGGSGFPLP